MIGTLSGTITHKGAGYILLDCSGVGYKVFVTAETYQHLAQDSGARLWTHLAIRDDAHELYGFETHDELSFFELLIGISGVGPKSALAILSMEDAETLRSAIVRSDSTYLTKVSGIGRKNAEKIILELKDKLGAADEHGSVHATSSAEVLEALHSLGYNAREAREALKAVPPEVAETGERLKVALKTLGAKTK